MLRSRAVRVLAAVVVGVGLLVAAWPAAAHWTAREASTTWVEQADALGLQLGTALGVQARLQPEVVSVGVAVAPVYLNPLRNTNGLVLERVDMGVDFSGTGPVYALGDGVVTNASASYPGWNGGWITYQLTDGPAAGLMVYVAEDISPVVQVGQRVSASTVVGYMYQGGNGIETGWAQPGGQSAESQLPEAGAVGGLGPFPTAIGLNFDQLLETLGVSPAPNAGQAPFGILPAAYPRW